MIRSLTLTLVGPLFCCAAARGDERTELLEQVRAGHRASREAIRTLSATVAIERLHPTRSVIMEGKYWRSLDLVRVQEGKEGAACNDYLRKNDEVRQVGRSWGAGKGVQYMATRKPASDFFCTCDAWRQMMIDIPGPNGGQLSYDRLLEVSSRPPEARRDTLDGRACIRVSLTMVSDAGVEQHVTLWHDVGYNYFVRKLVATIGADKGVRRITEFAEPSPGIVFPVRCQGEHFRDGELLGSEATTLKDLVINKPLPDALLVLPSIPRDTTLQDKVLGLTGPIDSGWNPIGPMKPLPKAVHAGPAPGAVPAHTAPSTAERIASSWWVVAASFGVLLLAAVIALIRRWHSPGTATEITR
jgi:hypothetical protein